MGNEISETRSNKRRVTIRCGIALLYAVMLMFVLLIGVGEWFIQVTLATLLAMDLYRTFTKRGDR